MCVWKGVCVGDVSGIRCQQGGVSDIKNQVWGVP